MNELINFNETNIDDESLVNKEAFYSLECDEWTAEEFYDTTQSMIFTESGGVNPNSWFGKLVTKMILSLPKSVIERTVNKSDYLANKMPFTKALKTEFGGYFELLGNVKLKFSIIDTAFSIYLLTRYIVHNEMFKKALGRFPNDMMRFCQSISELPEDLSEEDIKKLKKSLKVINKDVKWLESGSYGKDLITPKEKKLCNLMGDQIRDLTRFGLISKNIDKQHSRRINDRIKQFVDTVNEFFELIHSDAIEYNRKETIKEYMI